LDLEQGVETARAGRHIANRVRRGGAMTAKPAARLAQVGVTVTCVRYHQRRSSRGERGDLRFQAAVRP
jgi:hypothetical protein